MYNDTQKITAHLPKDLLKEAQAITGLGITDTLKEGLERIRLQKVYAQALGLQGRFRDAIPVAHLRDGD
jgi:hypothetical protein